MQQQELSTSNLDADLEGIISLARRHIQVNTLLVTIYAGLLLLNIGH